MLRLSLLWTLLSMPLAGTAPAQQPLPSAVRLEGLRSVGHHGAFRAAGFLPDGTLVLLYDQADGVRLIKTDAGASTVLGEVHLGAAHDTGVALTTDTQGHIYVGGTSASGALSGTAGSACPNPVDTSVNSFVAGFDAQLNLQFLSFLGAGNTALIGLAVTDDAVFATGLTYSSSLPTTPGAMQPSPAAGAGGNGFVERFSVDGTALIYATYLTGSGGSVSPAAIAADAGDHAFVTGFTSSPDFPSVAALQPVLLGSAAGFVSELTPAGDNFVFSTFVAGAGLQSIALDPSTGNLLLTGDVAPGQFPVSHASAPLASTPYQTVLRLSGDGQALLDSAFLLPGTESSVVAGPHGTAWVTGTLTAAATGEQAGAGLGDSYLLHLTASDEIDAVFRLGGEATSAPAYASLHAVPGPPALRLDASTVVVPATVEAATDPSFAPTQTFALGLSAFQSALLPNTIGDVLPPSCGTGVPCSGTAGLLTVIGPATGTGSLSFSDGNGPTLTIGNAGPGSAEALIVTATGLTLTTDCPQTLPPGAQCGALLSNSGSGSGLVTASAANAAPVSLAVSSPLPPTSQSLVVDTAELNFGIVTAAASPVTKTLTVTNLGPSDQTFASAAAAVPTAARYTLGEISSTCTGPPGAHTLAPASSCAITVALSASSSPTNDSTVHAAWTLGQLSLPVSGYTQAGSLALSTSSVDFGPSPGNATLRLPRFVALSNPSPFPLAHAAVTTPADQPFAVDDRCPAILQPGSICQIGIRYTQTSAPSVDTLTLTLDAGLSVLITGQTLASAQTGANALPVPPLAVTPAEVQFASPVLASGVSTEVQTVHITNTSTNALSLAASVVGEFVLQNTCPSVLAANSSCDLGLQFAPAKPGLREGLLTLSAGTGFDVISVSLSGTGMPVLTAASDVNLGETPVGEPVTAWFQVQDTLPALTVAAAGGGFAVALLGEDGNGHGTLPAQAFIASASGHCNRCWLGIQFLPTAPGPAQGMLQLTTAADGTPTMVALHALGLPAQGLLLTPGEQTLQATPTGSSSAPVTFTLTNLLPNNAAANLTGLATTGDFQVLPSTDPTACAGTLAPTASCSIAVAFAPTQGGARAGTLSVISGTNAATATLAGTGTEPSDLAISPTTLTFTQTAQGTVTLTNTTSTALNVLSPLVGGSAFTATSSCSTLAPGQHCTATVSFTAAATPVTGTLTLPAQAIDDAGQPVQDTYVVLLNGLGTSTSAGVSVLPAQADFGTAPIGSFVQVRQFRLSNTSATALTISLAASRNFPLAAAPACGTLPPGGSCTFAVLFLPETAGPLTGNLVVTATHPDGTAAGETLAYLRGYGVSAGTLAFSDGTDPELPLAFGTVHSGATASQTVAVINSGNSPVVIRRLSMTAPFQAASTCAAVPLQAGASCNVTLTYAPLYGVDAGATHAPRADHSTLLVESDAASSPGTLYLSGSVQPTVSSATAFLGALPTYTLSQSAFTFPNAAPGAQSAPQALTLANNGSVPVTFSAFLTSPDFAATTDCAMLLPGQSCAVQLSFTPPAGSAPAIHAQTLEIVSDAAEALDSASLLGSSFAAPLVLNPSTADFGLVLIGTTAQLTLTLTNGSTLPVALEALSVAGDYAITASTCPPAGGVLPAGQTCTLTISFKPVTTGPRPGTLTVSSPGLPQALSIALTGTGIAPHLAANPLALSFGTVYLNAQTTLTVHLTNTGSADVINLTSLLSGQGATLFALSAACPATLPPDASCDLPVSFRPVTTGPDSATLILSSSDPSGPVVISLTGTGSLPASFTLTANGGSTASTTVQVGASAIFQLLVTPQGGFSGPVALTCTPVHAAPNASCATSASQLAILGVPVAGSATIATQSGLSPASPLPWTWLFLVPPLAAMRRRQRFLHLAYLGAAILATSSLAGCGGDIVVKGYPYTPVGSYTYQVTASSTTGPALTSSVTLAVIVQ